jgi:hypothetical protein
VERVINNCGKLIGGGANQTAMLEVWRKQKHCSNDCCRCTGCHLWMGFYFMELKKSDKIDKWLKADNSPIAELEKTRRRTSKRTPLTTNNIMIVLMVALSDGFRTFLGYNCSVFQRKLSSIRKIFFY